MITRSQAVDGIAESDRTAAVFEILCSRTNCGHEFDLSGIGITLRHQSRDHLILHTGHFLLIVLIWK